MPGEDASQNFLGLSKEYGKEQAIRGPFDASWDDILTMIPHALQLDHQNLQECLKVEFRLIHKSHFLFSG